MQKNFIAIFVIFICTTSIEFAALRCSPMLKKSLGYVQNEILKAIEPSLGRVQDLDLLLEVPLNEEIKNKIFQLALERGVPVSIFTTAQIAQMQKDMFTDMQKEYITVKVLPNTYKTLAFQDEDESEEEFQFLKFVDSCYPDRYSFIALMRYDDLAKKTLPFDYHQKNIAIFGQKHEILVSKNNDEEFSKFKTWFSTLYDQASNL